MDTWYNLWKGVFTYELTDTYCLYSGILIVGLKVSRFIMMIMIIIMIIMIIIMCHMWHGVSEHSSPSLSILHLSYQVTMQPSLFPSILSVHLDRSPVVSLFLSFLQTFLLLTGVLTAGVVIYMADESCLLLF